MVYGLDLTPDWSVHPVFHVSNLKKFHWSRELKRADQEEPPPLIAVDGHEEYEVEAILRHKGKGARISI